jgi:hypothetical protein
LQTLPHRSAFNYSGWSNEAPLSKYSELAFIKDVQGV